MRNLTITTAILIALSSPVLAFGGDGGDANAKAVAGASAGAAASVTSTNRNTNTNLQGQVQGQLQGQTQSATQSQGNSQNVSFNDRRQAPSVVAPSMSSGHPCALPTTGGISIIGGGISGGMNAVDSACMLFQSGQIDAANYILAARDNNACKALRATGAISSESLCGEEPRAATVSTSGGAPTASLRPQTRPTLYSECEQRDDNTVFVKHRFDVDKAASKAQCLAALGY